MSSSNESDPYLLPRDDIEFERCGGDQTSSTAVKRGSFFVPCLRPSLNEQHVLLMKRIYENRLLFDEAVKLGGDDCVLDAGAGTCTVVIVRRGIFCSSFFGFTPIDDRCLSTGIFEGGPRECANLCNKHLGREFSIFRNDIFERPLEYPPVARPFRLIGPTNSASFTSAFCMAVCEQVNGQLLYPRYSGSQNLATRHSQAVGGAQKAIPEVTLRRRTKDLFTGMSTRMVLR